MDNNPREATKGRCTGRGDVAGVIRDPAGRAAVTQRSSTGFLTRHQLYRGDQASSSALVARLDLPPRCGPSGASNFPAPGSGPGARILSISFSGLRQRPGPIKSSRAGDRAGDQAKAVAGSSVGRTSGRTGLPASSANFTHICQQRRSEAVRPGPGDGASNTTLVATTTISVFSGSVSSRAVGVPPSCSAIATRLSSVRAC